MANDLDNVSSGERWVHRIALVTACATLPLIVVGGLVTTYRVGMADTVWPTAPWYLAWLVWVGQTTERGIGFLIEHGHRLLGWIVGFLTLVLAVWIWLRERRRWVRWCGVAALGGVAVQGLLGGLRVLWISREVAVVHACLAQAFFVFMVCLAVFTSPWWRSIQRSEAADAGRLQRLALMTTGFIFLQIIFGAILRHLGPTWALVAHLVTAFLVVLHVALLAKRVFVAHSARPLLAKPVEILAGLVLVQLMLGAAAWATSPGFGDSALHVPSGMQVISATLHVLIGALIFATSAVLTVNSYRTLAAAVAGRPAPVTHSQSRWLLEGSQ